MSISQNFPALKPSLLLDFANTKKLDSRVTFARASEGRYYGQEVAKAEENLLLRSQEFNVSPWSVSNGSITGTNTETAPDGTLTADVFTSSAAFGTVQQTSTTIAGQTYTFSCWIKAGTSTSDWSLYDASAAITIATITPSASWQRIEGSWTPTVNNAILRITDRDNDNTGSVVLWGAQLEQRSSVTAYTPTTTQPITNYIPVLQTASANIARFDHDPVTGESLGLLVEEQRTNLLTYSEDFSDSSWTKIRSSIAANTVVAPDGTLTCDKLIGSTDNNSHYMYKSYSLSASTFSFSVYAKAGEYSYIRLSWSEGTSPSAVFNLSDGTVFSVGTGVTASIIAMGNGWYRCVYVKTNATTGSNPQINIVDNSGNGSFTGDGYSGIYIWGAQLEAGAFPTSYIPTTTSQVTRSADSASMAGENFSSWFSNAEGTLYVEALTNSTAVPSFFSVSDGTSANRLQLRKNSTQGNVSVVSGNATQVAITAGSWTTSLQKASVAYKVNDVALSVGGSAVATDTSVILPIVNQAEIGYGYGSVHANGTIKKLAYYPQRLSNTNLQALTS